MTIRYGSIDHCIRARLDSIGAPPGRTGSLPARGSSILARFGGCGAGVRGD